VIADPPLFTGGVKVIVASPLPRTAVTLVGAPGVVAGVIELLVGDEEPVPFAFVAVTVKVYVVPFVRPVTVIGESVPVAVCPRFEVTVYCVMVEPPLLTGGVKVIVASPLPATADTLVGAFGMLFGVIELLVVEAALSPSAFVAMTVKVYVVPFVRPVMVIGEAPPVAV
jgi:hypothetical protein